MAAKKDLEGLVKGDLIELEYTEGPRFLHAMQIRPFYFVSLAVKDDIEMVEVAQDRKSKDTQYIPLHRIGRITRYKSSE